MTREEVQKAWVQIVEIGFSDYKKLTRNERVWFNVEPLITGGLWDHYMNNGADRNSDTIEDLDYLNFHLVADQLRQFNAIFFGNGIPLGPDARQEEFDKFSEKQLQTHIDEMDDKFWKISRELEARLLEHIQKTGIGIEYNSL